MPGGRPKKIKTELKTNIAQQDTVPAIITEGLRYGTEESYRKYNICIAKGLLSKLLMLRSKDNE